MKKTINCCAALILFVFILPPFAYADDATTTPDTVTTTEPVDTSSTTTPPVSIPPQAVDVPDHCTATDIDGVQHAFPQSDSPSNYLGICLLEAAKEAGHIGFTLKNDASLGLYIQSVNSIEPGSTEYWAIWDNGAMAECGIGCIPLTEGNTLSFVLTDWMTNAESKTIAFLVHSLIQPPPSPAAVTPPAPAMGGNGGGGGVTISHSQLNVPAALAYLANQQHADGSFDATFLSDWAALAFTAADSSEAKTKLYDYFLTASSTLSSVTDYERHAMALEALGINPYSGTSIDYIAPIVNSFDGTQMGEVSLDNDDIFALSPLLHAGYSASDALIQKTIIFILSAQNGNGAWDESVDMTAAAVQALALVQSLPNVPAAIEKAKGYLLSQQQANGGFGNSFSTSWALQAIAALNEPPLSPAPTRYTSQDYLATLQQSDGGVEPPSSDVQTRIWATAYAIPASLNKTWDSLLQSFTKPKIVIATTTIALNNTSTSSPPIATSTQKKSIVRQAKAPVAPSLPILSDQTAAVANAPASRNIFTNLWNFIASFFGSIL